MKLNKYDIFLITLFIAVYFVVILFIPKQNKQGQYLKIITENHEKVYSLFIDKTIEVKGIDGITYISISNGKVNVTDSKCPHKICVKSKEIYLTGQIISCVPNGVYLFIEGKNGNVDAITK